MTQTLHKSDAELKSDVVDELEWTPNVDPAHIGVTANDGVITLSGEVGTYPEKRAAEQAALRVRGVTAVADEITVRNTWTELADTDIAREVGQALTRSVAVPADAVKAVVHNHVVTLSGMVTWNFQREVAERAVRYLKGVTAVHNRITVKPLPATGDVKKAINSALVRNAQLDSNGIEVTVADGIVTLTGDVQSWAERRQAEHASWSAPGVVDVKNLLRIRN
jgi:osmotically-inducible protein OsmY